MRDRTREKRSLRCFSVCKTRVYSRKASRHSHAFFTIPKSSSAFVDGQKRAVPRERENERQYFLDGWIDGWLTPVLGCKLASWNPGKVRTCVDVKATILGVQGWGDGTVMDGCGHLDDLIWNGWMGSACPSLSLPLSGTFFGPSLSALVFFSSRFLWNLVQHGKHWPRYLLQQK
jgi:hypothetical protein